MACYARQTRDGDTRLAGLGRTVATLRFFGDDLDPDEISRLLGVLPTKSARKGAIRRFPNGREVVPRRGSWRLEVPDRSPGDLSSQIVELLSTATGDLSVWSDLSLRYAGNVFCGLFMEEGNEGEELSPEAMFLMGARKLRLDLDIYGPTTD